MGDRVKELLLDIFDIVAFLVFVGGIVLCIRFFVANPYTVVGASMSPTFEESDFIIVDKITQRFSSLDRGDILVFVPPGKNIPYIKRVIGLPGETVKVEDGHIVICEGDDCNVLEEEYLSPGLINRFRCGITEFDVQDGFFVLGDNRGYSTDSSCCFGLGCYEGANYVVPHDHIIGKVLIRLFPNFSVYK